MNTTSPARSCLLAGGLLGLTGVALGALGTHALAATLTERGMSHAWDTGSRYQLYHAVALLGLGAWAQANGTGARAIGWAARLWTIGVILFSGSLYGLALTNQRWLGPVTPLGGLALISGWLCVVIGAWQHEK